MKVGWIGGLVMTLSIAGMGNSAFATTWKVICLGGPGTTTLEETTNGFTTTDSFTDPGGLYGSGTGGPDALGALLGTPDQGTENATLMANFNGLTLASGDTVEVNGICEQVVEIRTSNITITGHNGNVATAAGPPGTAPMDGDNNQIIVSGAQGIIFNGFLFGNGSSQVSLSTTGFAFAQTALLTVVNGSSVLLENSEVAGSPDGGIFVSAHAQVALQSSLVTDNGAGNTTQNGNIGIYASDASAVALGASTASGVATGAFPVTVSDNSGDGIRVEGGSALAIFAGTVSGNGKSQLFIGGASAGRLLGNDAALVTIGAPPSNVYNAVDLQGASSLLSEGGASITGGTSGAATAISATGGSTMLLQGSLISGGTVTVDATGGSLIELAGGNSICNGTLTLGGPTPSCTVPMISADAAVEVDHVSALNDVGGNILDFGFSPAVDSITGAGVLELQSTADLGAGQISGQPSLVWTTGPNGISVAQNSSLRLEGGVTITGAIDLAQGSNGFVNLSKTPGVSDANTVSAGISCAFTTVPSAHLQLGKNSLAASTPATVLATSLASAASPQCLPF
jgi:hypothetical protein